MIDTFSRVKVRLCHKQISDGIVDSFSSDIIKKEVGQAGPKESDPSLDAGSYELKFDPISSF